VQSAGWGWQYVRGQAEGEITTPATSGKKTTRNQWGDFAPLHDTELPTTLRSPVEIFNNHAEATDSYAMADGVSDEEFELAISEAKDDGNLSRANVRRSVERVKIEGPTTLPGRIAVARKLAQSGNTSEQIAASLSMSRPGVVKFLRRHEIEVPADAHVRNTRNLDSQRIVTAAVGQVDGIGMLFDRIDYSQLDLTDAKGWVEILNQSIRSLTTLRNRLKELTQP
jgi:hypothetical protein